MKTTCYNLFLSWYTGDCLYRYLREPPSGITCNPWAGPATLKVQCQVSIPLDPSATIDWFFNGERITGSFPPLQAITQDPDTIIGRNRRIITSTIIFEGGADDRVYSGNYYCRLLVNNCYTNRSSILNLLTQDDYIFGQPCNVADEPQFIVSNRCVGFACVPALTTDILEDTTEESFTPETSTNLSSFTPSTLPNSTSMPPNTGTLKSNNGTMDDSSVQVLLFVLTSVVVVFAMAIVGITFLLMLCFCPCLKKRRGAFQGELTVQKHLTMM